MGDCDNPSDIIATKSVRIWSYSGPYYPAFGLNMERYSVSFFIQSECRKIRTRITPNTRNFYAVTKSLKAIVTLKLLNLGSFSRENNLLKSPYLFDVQFATVSTS